MSLKGPLPLSSMTASKKTPTHHSPRREEAPQPPVPEGTSPAIDLQTLARAVRYGIGHDGMRKEDAEAISSQILNFFGFNERIIDNVLEPDDRDMFYTLEDCGILATERDETTLYDGREWRIHYWMFRKDRILEYARRDLEEYGDEDQEPTVSGGYLQPSFPPVDTNVYKELGDDAWTEREGVEDLTPMTVHRVVRTPRHRSPSSPSGLPPK